MATSTGAEAYFDLINPGIGYIVFIDADGKRTSIEVHSKIEAALEIEHLLGNKSIPAQVLRDLEELIDQSNLQNMLQV